MSRLATIIVRYPIPIRAFVALLTLCAALAGTRLRFDFSPQTVYEGRTDIIEFSEQHKELFGHEDALIICVIEATGETDVLDADALGWQRRLLTSLGEVKEVRRINCLASLQAPRRRGIRLRMEPLLSGDTVTLEDAAKLRSWVGRYPLLNGVLISENRRLATVIVEFDPDARAMADTRRVVESVRAAIAGLPGSPRLFQQADRNLGIAGGCR